MKRFLSLLLILSAASLHAAEWDVPVRAGAISETLAQAADGDTLRLGSGTYFENVVLDRPVILDGQGHATIDAQGTGTVVTVTSPGAVVQGLTVIGSGSSHDTIDSGIKLTKTATGAQALDNVVLGNLYGIDIHGAKESTVAGNRIEGRLDHRMNDRGNGVYVWNAPGAVVQGNDVRYGRDGIFVNSSRKNIFRDNVFRELRFAVHFMYANGSTVSGNVSIGNDLGYAIMFTKNVEVLNNVSIDDREHGIAFNYTNSSDIRDNYVRSAQQKCAFLYNSHKNDFSGNWFEGCGIGIHFTGSDRNRIVGNSFIANRTQVKLVTTNWYEWSEDGEGNYYSDNAAYDVNGDGISDAPYRPNDSMDHVLWTQPAAKLLLGSPAVQLVRWSQSAFPALLPGGVIDSHPLMKPVKPDVNGKVQHDG